MNLGVNFIRCQLLHGTLKVTHKGLSMVLRPSRQCHVQLKKEQMKEKERISPPQGERLSYGYCNNTPAIQTHTLFTHTISGHDGFLA